MRTYHVNREFALHGTIFRSLAELSVCEVQAVCRLTKGSN
jgi:hypothetical protein